MDKKNALVRFAFIDESNASSEMVEVTVQIREDQAFALEAIMIAERQSLEGGDQSALFQQALDLFINTRLKVVRLGNNKQTLVAISQNKKATR